MQKILLIVVGAVLLVVAAVAITLLVVNPGEVKQDPAAEVAAAEETEGDDEDVAEEGDFDASNAVYHEFHPNFVVNITDGPKSRYLAIDLAAVADSQSAIDALRNHMPALRNDLILLFSSQKAEDLRSSEGKEGLRKQTLAVVQKVMDDKYGEPAIEDVYFNKFVIQ